MIVFCELGFSDGTHVPFNAGLLATVQIAYPKEEFQFFASAQHIEELKQQVGRQLASSISWKTIVAPRPDSNYFKRFVRELSVLRRLIKTLPPTDSTFPLILTSAYPSTVLAMKIARWSRWKQIPVQIVLHGVSGVVGKRYRRPIRRCQDTKTALTVLGNTAIQYLVLEESIRDTMRESLPFLSGHIEALDHPISPNVAEAQTSDLNDPIRFGFLGFALKSKGFPLFVDVANAVTAKYVGRAEFHAIGRAAEDGSTVNGLEVLATKPARMQMTRNTFMTNVSTLHYIVLPHEPGPYTLTASGVLLDAIALGKPVIARKIPIFESIFVKHGDIGYLFDKDSELRGVVEQILQAPDISRYRRQVLNLRSLRKARDPEALARTYREVCRRYQGV